MCCPTASAKLTKIHISLLMRRKQESSDEHSLVVCLVFSQKKSDFEFRTEITGIRQKILSILTFNSWFMPISFTAIHLLSVNYWAGYAFIRLDHCIASYLFGSSQYVAELTTALRHSSIKFIVSSEVIGKSDTARNYQPEPIITKLYH